MKISYGISKDSKGTPRARRFMQCYVLRIARANIQCLVTLASESVIMAHGVADALTATEEENCVKMVSNKSSSVRKTVGVMGSRRIFAPAFKLKVLDSYRNDIDCRGNQRATARKYGIHRRQIQKWLQCEDNLRSSCVDSGLGSGTGHAHARSTSATDSPIPVTATIGNSEAPNAEGLRNPTAAPVPALNLSRARLHGDEELSPPAPQQGPPLRQHCPASPRFSPQPTMPQNGNPLSLSTTMHPPPTGLNQEQPHQQHHHHHRHQQHHGHLHQQQQQQHHSQQHKESQQQQHQQQQHQQEQEQRFSAGISQSEYTPARRSDNVGDLEAPLHRHALLATEDQVTSYYLPSSSYDIELARCDASAEVKLYPEPTPHFDDVPTPSERYAARNNHRENFSAVSATRQDIGSRISPAAAAAATIKSEPDAVATAATTAPGPCDAFESTSGRPSSRCERVSPLPPRGLSPPHRATTAAVHFERLRTSPLRTQAGNGAQPGENSGNVHKDGSSTVVLRRQTTARSSAYPQTHPQSHPQLQPQSLLAQTHARSMDEAEYVADLVQPPASARSTTLPQQCFLPPSASPPVERVLYSSGPPPPPLLPLPPGSPPSPQCSRGASSSGLSTTSSDSETDALDYSTTTLTPSNDLARRRSFSLRFKLDVLNAFHCDVGVAGNQRATARKFGINRRQVQKWLSQETELRGEIALRGGVSRQRLGPLSSGDSPIDLRTNPPTPTDLLQDTAASQRVLQDTASSTDSYCCYSPETVSHHHGQSYLAVSPESAEILSPTSSGRACNLSCCADNGSCYSQESLRISESSGCPKRNHSCYAAESHAVFACFSIDDVHQSVENSATQQRDRSLPSCYDGKYVERARLPTSSPLKRSCPPSCCSYAISPKRSRTHHEDIGPLRQPCCEEQPQDVPLCLVKSKGTLEPACQPEPVTSTVPTPPTLLPAVASLSLPPAVTSTKQDAILFKPYLDNPIAKPVHDTQILPNGSTNHHNSHPHPHHHHHHHHHHHQSKNNNNSSNVANNNNNCQNARNLNSHIIGSRTNESYALEFSLSVPISWAASLGPYSDISQVGSAFVRYPTTLPYT